MKVYTTLFFLLLGFTLVQGQTNDSFDFLIGIDRTYRNINVEDTDVGLALLNSTQGEKAKNNWRVGLSYRKGLSENIYLKIGARLSSLGYTNEKTGLRWGSQHDGEGGFDPSLDPDLPSEGTFSTNHLFIELPVSFGVTKRVNKFSFFAEAGVSPNFYLTTRTKQVLDGEESTTENQKNPGIRLPHLAAIFGVGIAYHINEKISITAQPSFRYHFTRLGEGEILKEYLYSYGVEFGLRKNL